MSATNTTMNPSILTQIGDAFANLEKGVEKYYNALFDYSKTTGKTPDNVKTMLVNDQVKLYANRNFKDLAKANLKKPINDDGDTIVHLMAYKNDKEAFDAIKKQNPKALTGDVINNPNKQGELPILLAARSSEGEDNDFVEYMVSELGANPNIADKSGRIISQEIAENNFAKQNKESINNLNALIMANIDNLTQLNQKSGHTCSMNKGTANAAPRTTQKNIEFVKELTAAYTKPQAGGYTGKRVIPTYNNDITETGKNDSFVIKNKNALLNKMAMDENSEELYTDNSDSDIKPSNKRNITRTDDTEDDDDIDTPDLGFSDYRSSRNARGSINNPDASRASRARNNQGRVKRFMDEWQTEEFDLNTVTKGGQDDDNVEDDDVNTSDVNTDYIQNNDDRNDVTNISNERYADFDDDDDVDANERYTDANERYYEDDEVNDEEDNTDDDTGDMNDEEEDIDEDEEPSFDIPNDNDDYSDQDRPRGKSANRRSNLVKEQSRRPRRPRDPAVDEKYKSFIQILMDKLNINEEQARLYRSAIKILIERENPELKGYENDALKVKRIEEILNDDKKFRDLIKRVDEQMDEIKRHMAEQREKGEQRKKEWEERRKTFNKNDKKESTKETPEEEKSDTNTTEKKPKRRRGTKVNEDGYLESEEIIFSPTY